jgi:transposase
MSINVFTEKQIKILSNNQYVSNVSDKAITYTDEFKHIFMSENEIGKLPRLVFEEHGLNIDI